MESELKAGVCLNYISIVVRLSTSFFLTPFIITSLGQDEYGLFMLSTTILAWLSLTDFGLGGAVSRYVATYRAKGEYEKQAHFLGQSTMLYSVLGVVTLVVGLAIYFRLGSIYPNLDEHQRSTLQILYLLTLGNMVLAFPIKPLGSVPGAYLKFIVPGIVNLIASLLNTGLTVLLLMLGYKSIGLTVLGVSLGVANLVWGLFYTFRCLGVKLKFSKPDIPMYREMLVFSFWIFLGHMMDLFYWRAGTPILARTSTMVAVTIFTVGISFAQYFITASTAISSVIAPKLMHMVALNASKSELTQVMIRTGRLQFFFLIIILIGFFCLGQDFLQLWVGSSLGKGTNAVWLGALFVLVPLMVPLTQNTGLAILQALNIHKGRAVILFYSSLLCVILGIALSHLYGVIGMFVGTAVSLIIGQIILINMYYSRKAGLLIGQFFHKTYLPALLPVTILGTVGFIANQYIPCMSWGAFIIFASILTILTFITLFIFYLNGAERDMFLSPFFSLIKKIRHAHGDLS